MLNKIQLLKILNSYNPGILSRFVNLFHTQSGPPKLKELYAFVNSLTSNDLSIFDVEKLENILKSIAIDSDLELEIKRIHQEISKLVNEHKKQQDYFYQFFARIFSVWTNTHYFERARGFLNTIREIQPVLLSNNQNSIILAENSFAIAYLALSFYLIKSPHYYFFIIGRLNQNLVQSIMDLSYLNKINIFKSYLVGIISLAFQFSLDLATGMGGRFMTSYISGLALESLVYYGFNSLKEKFLSKTYQDTYPKSIEFLEKIIRDGAFSAGCYLSSRIQYILIMDKKSFNDFWSRVQADSSNVDVLNNKNLMNDENVCHLPRGSYTQTCTALATSYTSTDSNLGFLCKIEMDCKKLDDTSQRNVFYIDPRITKCMDRLENCNGHLIEQTGEDTCNTNNAESIKMIARSRYNPTIFSQKACNNAKFTGSHQKTCKTNVLPYRPTDKNLAQNSICQITFECKTIEQKIKTTTLFSPPEMVNCLIDVTENCNGTPVFLEGEDNLCINPDKAIQIEEAFLRKRG